MAPLDSLRDRVAMAKRHPHRITITVSDGVFRALIDRSQLQGRSVSNLCATLIETSLLRGSDGR
jgi:hypothetical protein